MKTIFTKISIIIFLLGSINYAKAQNDEKDYEFTVDKNVKTKVSTMVYEAITDGDNIRKGKVIPYYFNMLIEKFYSYSEIYVDEYRNKLYEISYFDKAKTLPRRTVKVVYHNRKQVHATYTKEFSKDDRSYIYYTKKLYERDKNGNVINITEYSKSKGKRNYEPRILFSFKYNSNGNMIEKIEYTSKYDESKQDYIRVVESKWVYSHFDNKGNFQGMLQYNAKNQLILEVVIDNFQGGHIEYAKEYRYGQLVNEEKTEYRYDSNGNMISKSIIGKGGNPGWAQIPDGLTEDEREQYIYEHYYGRNLKVESTDRVTTYEYDRNKMVSLCTYYNENDKDYEKSQLDESSTLSRMFSRPPCMKVASYKYNYKGHWVEKIDYQPLAIITREYEYF